MSRAPSNPLPFLFLAAKSSGGRSVGIRRAMNRRQLADQLRRERMVPLRTWQLPAWIGEGGKVSLKDQAELNFQLSQLLTRGVPLVEALDVTATAVATSTKPLVLRMKEMVASGSSFADAALQTGTFDKVTVAVYRAAERTGDLGGAAKQLAYTARRQLAIGNKALTLMLYPAIVLTISIAVSLLVLTVIVPKIGDALESANVKLPAFTALVVGAGNMLRENILIVGLAVLAIITGIIFARKPIGVLIGRLSRSTPLLKDVVLAQESSRFFTVMAAMTRSGVTLGDALGVAVGVIGHPQLRKQLTNVQLRLIEGGSLRQLIDTVDALPLTTRRLMIAAERSGDLQTAFETLASDTAEEVDRRSQRLLAALEPLLIVFMFVVIGSLLLSIMIPLLKLSSQVG